MNYFLDVNIYYACDIYLECCEVFICPFCKVDNPVTYRKFGQIISSQVISYNPVQKRYPGY